MTTCKRCGIKHMSGLQLIERTYRKDFYCYNCAVSVVTHKAKIKQTSEKARRRFASRFTKQLQDLP